MKKTILTLSLLVVSLGVFMPAAANAATNPQIRVQIGSRHHRHWDRGRHNGWYNGRRAYYYNYNPNDTRYVRRYYNTNGRRVVRYYWNY